MSEKYCFGGGLGEACQLIRSANSWMLGHIVTMALSGGYIPSERAVSYGGNLQTLFRSRFNSWHFPNFGILLYQQSGFTSPSTVSLVVTNWRFVYLFPVCYDLFGNILSLLEYLNALISRLCYCKPTFASSTQHSQIGQLYERKAPIWSCPAFEMLARLLC